MAEPDYLRPYLRAARRHGAGFPTLLWASPATQEARFDAIVRLADLRARSVLDVGCGRADLISFLNGRGIAPADYTGIEALDELARVASRRCESVPWPARIVHADFVEEPGRLLIGARVVVLSGSLNTMDAATFYAVLRGAFEAAGEELVFNFLSSPRLAAASHLTWHRPEEVAAFAKGLAGDVRLLEDYLEGDCTLRIARRNFA